MNTTLSRLEHPGVIVRTRMSHPVTTTAELKAMVEQRPEDTSVLYTGRGEFPGFQMTKGVVTRSDAQK